MKDLTGDSKEAEENERNQDVESDIFKAGTPGTIVFNWRQTAGGHVACLLALMATGKVQYHSVSW